MHDEYGVGRSIVVDCQIAEGLVVQINLVHVLARIEGEVRDHEVAGSVSWPWQLA